MGKSKMDRSAWRRQQKKEEKIKKAQNHVMTQYEKGLSAGYELGRKDGIHWATGMCNRLMMTAVVSTLRDEWQFGQTRMLRFLNMVLATLQDISVDPEREQKLRDWIKKEIGIDLDDHTGCRRMDIAEELGFAVGEVVPERKEQVDEDFVEFFDRLESVLERLPRRKKAC